MVVVEVQNMEEMWILLAPLVAYVSKPGALAPTRLGFFFALDVYMTRCTPRSLRSIPRHFSTRLS